MSSPQFTRLAKLVPGRVALATGQSIKAALLLKQTCEADTVHDKRVS